jgi:hypothetical protein
MCCNVNEVKNIAKFAFLPGYDLHVLYGKQNFYGNPLITCSKVRNKQKSIRRDMLLMGLKF